MSLFVGAGMAQQV